MGVKIAGKAGACHVACADLLDIKPVWLQGEATGRSGHPAETQGVLDLCDICECF